MSTLETAASLTHAIPPRVPLHDFRTDQPIDTIGVGDHIVGSYQVQDILGEYCHAVYAVSGPHQESAAVKLLFEPDERVQCRTEREFAAMSLLSGQPGIVPLRGFGVTENSDGTLYRTMVMDLDDGDLHRHRAALTAPAEVTEAAMQIGLEIGSALEMVHHIGLAHGDVKPDNIFVKNGEFHLGDFGNASVIDRAAWRRAAQGLGDVALQELPVVPTTECISPDELYRGSISAQTDTYALGRTLCAFVLGNLAEAPTEPHGQTTDAREDAPVSLREVNRAVPLEFANLMVDCMASNPKDRPTIGEFIGSLQTI